MTTPQHQDLAVFRAIAAGFMFSCTEGRFSFTPNPIHETAEEHSWIHRNRKCITCIGLAPAMGPGLLFLLNWW